MVTSGQLTMQIQLTSSDCGGGGGATLFSGTTACFDGWLIACEGRAAAVAWEGPPVFSRLPVTK